MTFPCHVEDVRQAIPHAVVHQSVRYKSIRYMTRDFLLTLLQNLYDVFNLRDVRRRLFAIAASVLRVEMMCGSCVPSPTTAAALALALPSADEMQVIALRAFSNFAQAQADVMVRRQCLYNLAVVRGDGHYDIAARVYEKDDAAKSIFHTLACWAGAARMDRY